MAFFTRSKSTIPVLPGEAVDVSDDEWDDELEERRTPDGRSSKTFYELRRDRDAKATEPQTATGEEVRTEDVAECNNVIECGNAIECSNAIECNTIERSNSIECSNAIECNDVIECKNPCLNEPRYENLPAKLEDVKETEETKTDEVRYDFVVDRVLGVQV